MVNPVVQSKSEINTFEKDKAFDSRIFLDVALHRSTKAVRKREAQV